MGVGGLLRNNSPDVDSLRCSPPPEPLTLLLDQCQANTIVSSGGGDWLDTAHSLSWKRLVGTHWGEEVFFGLEEKDKKSSYVTELYFFIVVYLLFIIKKGQGRLFKNNPTMCRWSQHNESMSGMYQGLLRWAQACPCSSIIWGMSMRVAWPADGGPGRWTVSDYKWYTPMFISTARWPPCVFPDTDHLNVSVCLCFLPIFICHLVISMFVFHRHVQSYNRKLFFNCVKEMSIAECKALWSLLEDQQCSGFINHLLFNRHEQGNRKEYEGGVQKLDQYTVGRAI